MSNVHRISDFNSGGQGGGAPQNQAFPATGRDGQRIGQPQQGQQMPAGGQQGGGGMGGGGMMFMGGGGGPGGGGPMYPPINKVLAPNFNKWTFIFFISIIQILMFIAELIVGQVVYDGAFVENNDMAGPGTDTMRAMGAKYVPDIQDGQVFRFITPAILHAGILHIFTNMVSQTMIGYTCEMHWGTKRMIAFYLGTAFGATLLSCVGGSSPCNSVSVGASGALLGIIGCYMSWILLNWNNRVLLPQPCQRMCSMIWWLIIIALIGASSKGIDNMAHLGGWVSGFLIGMAFNQHSDPVDWLNRCSSGNIRAIKITFTVLTVIYFVSTLFSTFFAIDC